jgi:hypothetical protein
VNPNILACGLRGISNGKKDQHVQVEIVAEEVGWVLFFQQICSFKELMEK